MAIFKYLKNNFSAGRFSPLISKRSDIDRFKGGVKTLDNFLPMVQGGVTARTGSLFVSEVKDSNKDVRLIKFRKGTTDAYMLEFGHLYIRVYKDSGLVLDTAQNITNITKANPAVITYSGADNFTAGDQIYITGVQGMTQINSNTLYYTVGTVDTALNTFTLKDRDGTNVNSSSYSTYTSGGSINKIYTITSPYDASDIRTLDVTQSGDVITITHGDYQQRELTRISDTNWTLSTVTNIGGPFLDLNQSTTTLTPSAKTGSITITASAVTGINNDTGFQSTDIGRLIYFNDRGPSKAITGITNANPGVITATAHGFANGDFVYITDVGGTTQLNNRLTSYIVQGVTANTFTLMTKDEVAVDTTSYGVYTSGGFVQSANEGDEHWSSLLITARASTTSITATLQDTSDPLRSIVPQIDWRLGVFSDTTGHPEKCTYYQQRLILSKGEDLYGSQTDDYTNFDEGTALDSEAFKYTVATGEVNNITWLVGGTQRLRIGTEGGISSIWGGSNNNPLTPTNAVANVENTIKCKELSPVGIGNYTVFTQRTGKSLRELYYSIDTDSLIAPDITLLSEDILGDKGDITDEGVIQLAYTDEPYPIVWVATDSGNLATVLYDKEQQSIAWSNQILGGDGKIISVETMPINGQDRIFLVVERTINNHTRKYVEQLDTQFRNRDIQTAVFSDSHLQFTGEKPSATLTPGATTGSGVTFTASASVFSSTDVNRIIESNGSKALITSYTNATHVVCTILVDFSSTGAIASQSWNLSVDEITGLEHLEGMEVVILGNGGVVPPQTVANGTISLDGQYNYIGVGLGYTKKVELLDLDIGTALGTSYGSKGKVVEVFLEYFETVGGEIGFDEDNLSPVVLRIGTDLMGQGIDPQSGGVRLEPKGGFQDSIKTIYVNSDPLPATLLSMTIKGVITD